MSTTLDLRASTLSGIKRKAKSLRRDLKLLHHAALDASARLSGYESFLHAQRVLQREHRVPLYSTFVSVYWRDSTSKPGSSGLEILEVKLPRPLAEFLGKHQSASAQNLQGFFYEYADHLEMRSNADSQARARELMTRAALTLQFMESTQLRPVTTKAHRSAMEHAEQLPSSDHVSRWFCEQRGSWLMLDEPYDHVIQHDQVQIREAWVSANNLHWARPVWDGLYYPRHAIPHFVSQDAELLHRAVTVVERLAEQSVACTTLWVFSTRPYNAQFVSPARERDGKKRKPRPGTTYGFSKNAVEYHWKEGFASIWRPAQQMSMENHKEMGRTLKRLYISDTPYEAFARLKEVQSELENWMFAEYRLEERDDVDVDVYYGDYGLEKYESVEAMVGAVDHVRSIMKATYLDCKPLRDYLKKLESARIHILNHAG
ncbi:DUF5623 domain-containing protein [Pseudomonas putida]|uniref:DUF5623 domain-containing protein n=1 Tax=Pseudomonas putida TaxID=303 RepID=UPI003905BCD6